MASKPLREYPNVWPEGGLFAFSGIDGPTCHAEPFAAKGMHRRIGWIFDLEPRVGLAPAAGKVRCSPTRDDRDYFFASCWRGAILSGEHQGVIVGGYLDQASISMRVAFKTLPENVWPELQVNLSGHTHGDATVFPGNGWWLAIRSAAPAIDRRFGLAISYLSEDEAVQRASAAFEADINEVIKSRFQFEATITVPDSIVGQLKRAYLKAVTVHKANILSAEGSMDQPWTTPARIPLRGLSPWHSAFHVAGLRYFRPDLAESCLNAAFTVQAESGKLPVYTAPNAPSEDGGEARPPLMAWAAWLVYDVAHRKQFLQDLYPRLCRYLEWFESHRRDDDGLYRWRVRIDEKGESGSRGAESGMDNSPRFDKTNAITAVDLTSYIAGEYVAMRRIARALKDKDAFELWREKHRELAALANERFWDTTDRFYYDLNDSGEHIFVKTVAGLLPLHGRIPDRDQAESLRTHLRDNRSFWGQMPAASVARDEYPHSSDMWRGPSWPCMNLLLAHALQYYGFLEEARTLGHANLHEIIRWYHADGCFYEYYDAQGDTAPYRLPRKGAPGDEGADGYGVIEDFHPTAAAFIDFVHMLY